MGSISTDKKATAVDMSREKENNDSSSLRQRKKNVKAEKEANGGAFVDTDSTSTSLTEATTTSTTSTSTTSPKSTSTTTTQKTQPESFIQKLFSSKEETRYLHMHKILGISCLISFAYRLYWLGRNDSYLGPTRNDPNYLTLFFVAHHWFLNASSFIFEIPQRRIGQRKGGYRIWPEYRLHSLIFATRSLAFIAFYWYEQRQGIRPQSKYRYYFMDLLLVLLTCAMADVASYSQKQYQSNTVRGATFADPLEQHFASEMQLAVTAFCIVGYRRYSVHLLTLFNIQVNAFLMTLQRKNVAPHFLLMSCYTLMLLFSAVAITMDDNYAHRTGVAITFGSIAAVLRMGLGMNKYLLWILLFAAYHYIRVYRVVSIYNNWTCLNLFCVLRLVNFGMALYKRRQKQGVPKSPLILGLAWAVHGMLYWFLWYVNRNFAWRLLA